MVIRNPRCHLCNLFMSWSDDAMIWTPFGAGWDTDPPPDEYAHIKCWNEADPDYRRIIVEMSWSKPTKIGRIY